MSMEVILLIAILVVLPIILYCVILEAVKTAIVDAHQYLEEKSKMEDDEEK